MKLTMTPNNVTLLVLVAFLSSTANAFSVVNRKSFLQKVIAGSASAATVVLTKGPNTAAHADITNKVASSSALRSVKSIQRKLSSLADYVNNNDYLTLKESLRVAPVSDLRKSCFTLVRGGEDGPDAAVLEESYKTLIARLERMDSVASLGMRGRKLGETEFADSFQDTVKALDAFIRVAEEAAAVPVQYATEP